MIPYIKLLTLSVKLLTRPVANYARTLSLQKDYRFKHELTRRRLVALGRWHFQAEQKVDRLLLGVQDQSFFIKRQNEEQALLRGVDSFTELFIYALLISISTYEIVCSQLHSAQQKQLQAAHYSSLQQQTALLRQDALATDRLLDSLRQHTVRLADQSDVLRQAVRKDESAQLL